MKKTKTKRSIIAINVILGIIWLLPLYWTCVTSLKTESEIYQDITLFPRLFTWENYKALFQFRDGVFKEYFLNSIKLCLLTIIVVSIVSILAGFAFSKLKMFASKTIFAIILLTIMVPMHALLIPLYTTFADLNLIGTVWAMVIIYATFQTPFCTYMIKSSFDMVPDALREAAVLDGAGSFDIFRYIYLPLALPGAITVILYSAYTTWNDYTVGLTFGGSQLKTYNVGLVDILTNNGSYLGLHWGSLCAAPIIGMLPITIMFLFLQKYFIKGMMSGSVK